MAAILSHPLRLGAHGAFDVVEQSSDLAHGQQIVVLLGTRRGERPLAPTFGTTDPAFGIVDLAEVSAAVAVFGPPVVIRSVDTSYDVAGVAEVLVSFDSSPDL